MSGLSRYHQSCAGSPTVWLKITSKLSLFFTYRVSVSLSFCRISCLSYHVITCPVQVNLNFGSKSCLVCRVFTYHVSVSLTFCPKSRPRYRGITRPVRYRKLSRYLEVSLTSAVWVCRAFGPKSCLSYRVFIYRVSVHLFFLFDVMSEIWITNVACQL